MSDTKERVPARCRAAACGREIMWARDTETQRGVPIDPDPVPGGNLVRDGAPWRVGGEVPVRRVRKGEQLPDDAVRFNDHFKTCLDPEAFKR